MNINLKGIHVDLDSDLEDYATKRIEDVARLMNGDAESAVCDVEFLKDHAQEKGEVFKVAVNLEVPGKVYRAEAVTESFEASVDKVKDELWRELKSDKEKRADSIRKGGAVAKEMLRGEQ